MCPHTVGTVRVVNPNASLATWASFYLVSVGSFLKPVEFGFFHMLSSFPNNTETRKSLSGPEGGGLNELG